MKYNKYDVGNLGTIASLPSRSSSALELQPIDNQEEARRFSLIVDNDSSASTNELNEVIAANTIIIIISTDINIYSTTYKLYIYSYLDTFTSKPYT